MVKSPFEVIPGIGPSLAFDLEKLGYRQVTDLSDQDAEDMYQRLTKLVGGHVDRCVLYAFRCAVYFAKTKNPQPEKLLWWKWKN